MRNVLKLYTESQDGAQAGVERLTRETPVVFWSGGVWRLLWAIFRGRARIISNAAAVDVVEE